MTQGDWFSGVRAAAQNLTRFAPAIVGALLLLLAGWLVGRVLAWLARRAINALLARVSRRDALRHAIDSSGTARQMPGLIAGFVFWAWAHDRRKLGRIHPALLYGGVLLLVAIPFRGWLGTTAAWQPFAEWVLRVH